MTVHVFPKTTRHIRSSTSEEYGLFSISCYSPISPLGITCGTVDETLLPTRPGRRIEAGLAGAFGKWPDT